MNDTQSSSVSNSTDETLEPQDDKKEKSLIPKTFLGLELWEIGVLAIAVGLIAFVAIPNYFYSLKEMRGQECSSRLTLLANCLKYLAEENNTQPGEKICEQFDLNELLERVQMRTDEQSFTIPRGGWYYKVGAEPDCADVGDHYYTLTLGADGEIVPPTCTLGTEENRKLGLHVCDMSKVDGKLDLGED